MIDERSPATRFAEDLVRAHGGYAAARAAFTRAMSETPVVEQAAMMLDWEGFWARPKQLAPPGRWRTWGFLTGRMFGKTAAIGKFINAEVLAGRATMIGLAAQNLLRSKGMQVPALIETAPPWNRPEWIDSKELLVWPNGAKALTLTPEVPGAIRGDNFDLSWICELQSWPAATMEEAFTNFFLSTRVGLARIVWDCTPKKRHPLLLELLESGRVDPENHHVVRGTSYENSSNIAAGVLDDLKRRLGSSAKGREELGGEMLDDTEGATCEQAWIENNRRPAPLTFVRSVISIDPAVTAHAGSDESGIVAAGLGPDGNAYIREDLSGKHGPGAWSGLVLDAYDRLGCDLIIAETNKGGDLIAQTLRATAQARGLSLVVVDKNWIPQRIRGTVFVREIHSRGDKSMRAEPLSTAYELNRVSHVIGADLVKLEAVLTTWVPQIGRKSRSPDRLDACVGAVVELLGISTKEPAANPKTAFTGILNVSQALQAKSPTPKASRPSLASLLRMPPGGGRI